MPTIASAVLGTELLERVRDRAARYEPLGYNVIRDAEGAIEAYSAAAEAVLRLERWDITFKEHVNHAASLEKLRTLPHGLDCRELAEGHELDFATLERASTPTRKSGVFERQGSTPIPAVVELIKSPSKASLRPAKSFSDATAVTLAATATPPATDAASRPPSDDQARCANARRAVNAAIAELQILVRVVDLTFRQLSQIHFEIAMAGTKWRWIAQRSHRSRFGLRLLVVPWAHLFTKIPKLIFFADERLRVLREEDKIIHDALLHCRLCDAAVTQTIGTMHSVVSTIRAAMDDMLEDIEANPASTTEHDDKRTADALIRTAQELRSLVASASSKMLAACGGDAPKASDTQSHLKRPTYVALAVKTYLDKIQERLAEHQPPDAWPRVRTLALGTAAFLAFRYRDQIREIPAMVQMAVDSANSWMVDPTVRLVQKFFKPREQRNFSATAQEQAALKTMVVEYHQDMAKEALTSLQIQAIKDAVDRNDLGRVNDDFVEFTRKPWLPIIRGLLPRIVLIQIQQQKVDLGALIDSTNDILHQNDMAVSMFACTPFGVILFALLYWWRRRHQQQLRALFADMRVCWWKLHRIMCGQHATIHRGTRLISRAAAQEEEDAEDEAEAMARDVDDENRFAPSSSRDVGRRASAARPPPLKPATPPPAGVRSIGPLDGHAAIASPPLPAAAAAAAATAASVESAREDEGGRDGDAESSSWGGALQPREQGQVLIQVHALRVMSEMVWPEHHAEAKMRCLDDLDEIEAKDASREARLRVLDRMALSYNFLRQSEF